jgi:hypothetical protein
MNESIRVKILIYFFLIIFCFPWIFYRCIHRKINMASTEANDPITEEWVKNKLNIDTNNLGKYSYAYIWLKRTLS